MVRDMPLPISAQQPRPQRTLTPALLAVMWIALFGFSTFFLNYSTLVTIGQQMGLSAVTAGTFLTVMMVAVVGVQPVVPALNTRLGARTTFLIALGMQAAGYLVTLVQSYPFAALLAGSVIGGLGFGVLVVVGTAVVPSTVAPDRLGRALGFYGATTASAPAIGAPVGLWLISMLSVTEFRWLSFALVLVALPAVAAVPRKKVTEDSGPHSSRQHHARPRQKMHVVGLTTVLLPTAMVLTVFGLLLAFGPATDEGSAAVYIATMQVLVVVGRFLSSASLDRYAPIAVMLIGLGVTLVGLVFAAVLPAGLGLLLAMAVLGFGTGTVQSSSLVLAFRQAGSPNRGSVAWNMTFDIGLGIAGLVGGVGFTYLGAQNTYLACAGVLLVTSMGLAGYFRQRRRTQ
jgi:predicted MFS family arabinose efflux permease